MKKKLICFFYLSFFLFCAKAQINNTNLAIHYVPGFVEIYQKNYDKVSTINNKLRLTNLENYLFYKSVAENTAPPPLHKEMVYNFNYSFETSKPGLYYLLSNTYNTYVQFDSELPIHRLWLGKGNQKIDLYSVVENEDDLKNENTYFTTNHYRLYFEGPYEKQNKFLEQYTNSISSIEKIFGEMLQQKDTDNYDSTDAYKKQTKIELGNLYRAKKDTIFRMIDNVSEALNSQYKNIFTALDNDFDKVIQPELLTFANALKMYFCTYFISIFSNPLTIHTTEIIKIATAIRKEMDALPLQLSCENFRNTYFSYVNMLMWADKKDTIRSSNSNEVYFESIAPIINHQFSNQPALQEYLLSAAVDFMVNYMSFDATTIARKGFELFKKQYHTSVYNTTLDKKIILKEEKIKQKKDNILKENGDGTSTGSLTGTVSDTILGEEVTLTEPAFNPPRLPNDIDDKEVKFWNLRLYNGNNKVVKLIHLKGKRIAVKALIDLPKSRDMAYFQYLEKKFPALVFVYIFETVPNPSAVKLFKSFNLKGQCLFMKNSLNSNNDIGLWNDIIYYPYWQFINKKSCIKHIYQLDTVEKLISLWIQDKPLDVE